MRHLDAFDMFAIASLRAYGARYVAEYLGQGQYAPVRRRSLVQAPRVRPVFDTEQLERDSVDLGWRDHGGEG